MRLLLLLLVSLLYCTRFRRFIPRRIRLTYLSMVGWGMGRDRTNRRCFSGVRCGANCFTNDHRVVMAPPHPRTQPHTRYYCKVPRARGSARAGSRLVSRPWHKRTRRLKVRHAPGARRWVDLRCDQPMSAREFERRTMSPRLVSLYSSKAGRCCATVTSLQWSAESSPARSVPSSGSSRNGRGASIASQFRAGGG